MLNNTHFLKSAIVFNSFSVVRPVDHLFENGAVNFVTPIRSVWIEFLAPQSCFVYRWAQVKLESFKGLHSHKLML